MTDEFSMDDTDRLLVNLLQEEFPVVVRPFADLGNRLGIGEDEVLSRTRALKEQRIIRQIGAIFDTRGLGYQSTLLAAQVDPAALDEAAAVVAAHPGVSHLYARNHPYNLWFTLAVPPERNLDTTARSLGEAAGAQGVLLLPPLRVFKIGVRLDATGKRAPDAFDEEVAGVTPAAPTGWTPPTAWDRQLVRVCQDDLPIITEPFAGWADALGITQEELLGELGRLRQEGRLRRVAAVLRHRQAGFAANAMGVWVVPPDEVDKAGAIMAGFAAVSHCYERPSYPPQWPYNLFTMVHGRSPEECEITLRAIADRTGIRDYAALYSTREYKKQRLKYFVD